MIRFCSTRASPETAPAKLSAKSAAHEAAVIFWRDTRQPPIRSLCDLDLLSQAPEVEARLHAERLQVLVARLPTLADVPHSSTPRGFR